MEEKNVILNNLLTSIYKDIEVIVRNVIIQELSKISSKDFNNIKEVPIYLTATQAAEFLGRKISTLYKDVHFGNIPYHRSGGRKLLFSRRELENFVRKGKTKSKSEIDLEVSKYLQSENY